MEERLQGMKYLIESNLEDVIALTEIVATEVIRVKPKPRHTYWYIYHCLQALLKTRQCVAVAEERLKEKSAIKIQQFYRKYRGDGQETESAPQDSKKSCAEIDGSSGKMYDDSSEEEQAAIKIQQAFRAHQTCLVMKREEQQEQEQAAIKIQRAFRRKSRGVAESAREEFDEEPTKFKRSDSQESRQAMQDPGEFEDHSITFPSKSPTKKGSKSSKLKSFLSDINFLKRKTYAGVDLISPPSATAADAFLRRQTWAPAPSDRNMSKSPINISVSSKKSSTGPQPETSNFDTFLNTSPSNQRETSTPKISVSTSQLMQRNSFGSQPKINSSPVLESKRSTPKLSSSTSDLLSRQSPEPQLSDLSSCLNVSPIKLARVPAHRKHSVIVSSPVKKSRSTSTPTARKSVTAEHRFSMPINVSTINHSSPPPAPPGSPRSETLYSEPEVDTKIVKRHSSISIERKKSSPSETPQTETVAKTAYYSSLENGIIASPLKPPSFSTATETFVEFSDYSTVDSDIIHLSSVTLTSPLSESIDQITGEKKLSSSSELKKSSTTTNHRLSKLDENEENFVESGTPTSRAARRRRSSARHSTTSPRVSLGEP